ncbi:MAG: hypothetical protein WCG78_04330 [Candidatus Omnitrophota bacterium]
MKERKKYEKSFFIDESLQRTCPMEAPPPRMSRRVLALLIAWMALVVLAIYFFTR